jgi:hypothetical protein
MCFNHPLFLQTTPGTIFRISGGQKQRNYLDKALLLLVYLNRYTIFARYLVVSTCAKPTIKPATDIEDSKHSTFQWRGQAASFLFLL